MSGTVENPERARWVSNERLDLVDQDFLSQQDRAYLDVVSKAFLATPLATAASPVGLICTGASFTENPTSGADGLLRMNAELFVALDSDGRFLVKPSATTLDAAVPSGGAQHQVYAAFVEVKTKQAVRRAIPATAPYAEFSITPKTRFLGSVTLHVRAGGTGSIVASDVVNGVTTSLVFLGIASNTAGVVTYDGSAAINRIGTVKPPASRPGGADENGSSRTLHDLLSRGALYELARTKFTDQGGLSGSAASTSAGASSDRIRLTGLVGMNAAIVGQFLEVSGAASAANNGVFKIVNYVSATSVDVYNPDAVQPDANDGSISWEVLAHVLPTWSDTPRQASNFGAYTEPRQGLDAVDRASSGFVSIGDGATTFGTFDQTQFASDDLLIKAAFQAVAAQGGGVVYFKPGTFLYSFAADVDLDYGADPFVDVVFLGWRQNVENLGDCVLDTGAYTIKTPSVGSFSLHGMSVRAEGTSFEVRGRFEARDSVFVNEDSEEASVRASGTVSRLRFERCAFFGLAGPSADDSKYSAVDAPAGVLSNCDVLFDACSFSNESLRSTVALELGSSSGAVFRGCRFLFGVDHGSVLTRDTSFVHLVGGVVRGSSFSDCRFRGSATDAARANYVGIHLYDSGSVSVVGCHFDHVLVGLYADSSGTTTGQVSVSNCLSNSVSASNASSSRGVQFVVAPIGVVVSGCEFNSTGFTVGTPQTAGYDVSGLLVRSCLFVNSAFGVIANSVSNTFGGLSVEGNHFHASVEVSASLLAPIVSMNQTNGAARAVWSGNTHSGWAASDAATWCLGVRFVAYELDVLVDGNVFRNIDADVAYAGSTITAAEGAPNVLVAFDAHVHRWTVSNNVGERLGAGSSGADFQQVTCVAANVKVHGVVEAGAVLEDCVVEGNRFGDSSSCCSFLHVGGDDSVPFQIGSLRIQNNSHRSAPTVASTSAAAYGVLVNLEPTNGVNAVLDISGNKWWIDSVGTLSAHWFLVRVSATGTYLESCTIANNSIAIVGGAFASTYGIFFEDGAIDLTIRNFIFLGNTAFVPGAATDPVMYIICFSVGSVHYPTRPGAGNNWPGNLRIRDSV